MATSPQRSIYLDMLRAVALTRVVVYHAVAVEWVTLFTAMPLMFFIAGSLYAASLERRPTRRVIFDRYRRILIPYWVYIVAMIALWGALGVLGELNAENWVGLVFPVLSPNGPQGPGAGTTLELTWIALWYLQFHLILSLVGGWLRRAQQSHRVATWATLGGLFLAGLILGSGVIVVVFYVACWVLGYHQHDGDWERLVRRRWREICLITGPPGLALFLAFEPSSPWSLMSARLAATGAAMLGIFWLTFAMALRPSVEPLLGGRATNAVIHWFSRRSLTIYMWHLVAIYAAKELDLPGANTWPGTLAWVVPLTMLAVLCTGWAEDLAARRHVVLWPRPGR